MADKTKETATGPDRRGFLTLAGLGAVTTGTAMVTGETAEASVDTSEASGSFKETDHVRAYYETARF